MKIDRRAIQDAIEAIAEETYLLLLSRVEVETVSDVKAYLVDILDDKVDDEVDGELRGLLRGTGFLLPYGAFGVVERAAPMAHAKLKADGELRSQRRKRGRPSSNNQPFDDFG